MDADLQQKTSPRIIVEVDGRALCKTYRCPIGKIPQEFWQWLISLGAGYIWFKAVWEESPLSLKMMHYWSKKSNESLKRWASGYDVYRYRLNPKIASGEKEFKDVAGYLKKQGIGVILDFVTNHIAADSPEIERVCGLVRSYTYRGFVKALRTFFPEPTKQISDEELEKWLHTPDRAFSRYARNRDRIIQHARISPFDPAMINLAQVNYMDRRARRYMIETVLKRIANLTLNGGIRADLAFLAFRMHVYNTWAAPRISWEEFEAFMPCEFWEEFMDTVNEKYPGMLICAETYEWGEKEEKYPWEGRAGAFQSLGIGTYHKHLYDLLMANNVKGVRGYLFIDAPGKFLHNCFHFVENHDEPPAAEAFGSMERAQAAAVISYAIPGYVLIPLRQILDMRTPAGTRRDMKSCDAAIYEFTYPKIAFGQYANYSPWDDMLRFFSKPVFGTGDLYSAYLERIKVYGKIAPLLIEPGMYDLAEAKGVWYKRDIAHSSLIPFIRHQQNNDMLVVVNYSDLPAQAVIGFDNIFNYYKHMKGAPREMGSKLVDQFSSAGVKLNIEKKQNKARIELPAWGYGVFNFIHRSQ